MALTTSTITWRGMAIGGPSAGGDYQLRDISGWEELPSYNTQRTAVGGGHGTLVAPVQFDERVVTATGWCFNQANRDALLQALRVSMAPLPNTRQTESLTISHGGLELSADARIVAVQAVPEAGWAMGRFAWVLQWLCNDPLRYGPYLTNSAYLPQPGPGLALPASLPAAMPDGTPGGRFDVVNPGSALAPATYTLTGPIISPGVLLNSGTEFQRLVQYDLSLGAGDVLVISTSGGGAGLVNGEYRPPSGTSGLTADLMLRPGSNSVQALGTPQPSDPLPAISVTYRPAYW